MTVDDNETLMKSINAIGTNAIITDMIICLPLIWLYSMACWTENNIDLATYVGWYYF